MMSMDLLPVLAINPWVITLIVVLVVLIAAIVFLYIYGNKLQKKQETAQSQLEAGAQTVSLLVIDKKRIKLKDAGFPQIVLDQTPKWLRGRKVPIVKAKIGPKITNLMCDEKVFEKIPTMKEVKAVMNGIYIIDVKGLRSGLEQKKGKKGFFARLRDKAQKVVDDDKKERQSASAKNAKNTKTSNEASEKKQKK